MHSARGVRSSVAIVMFIGGCGVGTVEGLDDIDDVMLERAGHYRDLASVNKQPFASELGAFSIDCYVAGDVASYRRIHPEASGANVRLAAGSVIVRAVLDPDGRPAKLTVMGKGPPGFDPSLGDWWFAVTDPAGVPLEADGVLQVGRLAACHECHVDRARDDFLFGVPAGELR